MNSCFRSEICFWTGHHGKFGGHLRARKLFHRVRHCGMARCLPSHPRFLRPSLELPSCEAQIR